MLSQAWCRATSIAALGANMEYAHEKAETAIAALTVESTDADIAQTLATYLMVGKHAPFVFKINHNGAAAPCPVKIDKVHGAKHCSVALRNQLDALSWCIDALLRGYEISCGAQRGQEVRSIAMERNHIRHRVDMAAYRARRAASIAAGQPDIDDEIPF